MKGNFGDSEITVKREELLKRIRQNREKHREQYEAAIAGYKKAVTEWFEHRLKEVIEGKNFFDTSFRGPVPQDHTEDYDRVIDMLEMDINETLQISEQQFRMYVRDDWGWKQQFVATNSSYLPR